MLSYIYNRKQGQENVFHSPIYDLPNTSNRFGLLHNILEMVAEHVPCSAKKSWSRLVWQRAWALDDVYWDSTMLLFSRTDLLRKSLGKSQYLTWWFLADNLPHLQGTCETMARLVCHASQLKDDDVRLIGGSHSQKICTYCDLGIIETVNHMVMQCPSSVGLRVQMFKDMHNADPVTSDKLKQRLNQTFNWLMGMQPENIEASAMAQMWVIAGAYICKMYHQRISTREGVG